MLEAREIGARRMHDATTAAGADSTATETAAVPDGYRPWRDPGAFIEHNGQLYHRQEADGGFRYGFRAAPGHGNYNGQVHGGWLFSFADQVTSRVVYAESRRGCATVTLDARFLAPVQIGDWVEAAVETVRLTGSLAFMRCTLSVGAREVFTAAGVWRLLGDRPKDGT